MAPTSSTDARGGPPRVPPTGPTAAGAGGQVPAISRRSAFRTGGLAALAAGFLGTAGSTAVLAAPEPPAPTIDRAESLLREVIAIIPNLSERDQSNVTHLVYIMCGADG